MWSRNACKPQDLLKLPPDLVDWTIMTRASISDFSSTSLSLKENPHYILNNPQFSVFIREWRRKWKPSNLRFNVTKYEWLSTEQDLVQTLVASCLRGALPPVDLRAVCLVRAMITPYTTKTLAQNKTITYIIITANYNDIITIEKT